MLNRTAREMVTTDPDRAPSGHRFAVILPDGQWVRHANRRRATYSHRSDAISAAERVGGEVRVVRYSPPPMRIVYV